MNRKELKDKFKSELGNIGSLKGHVLKIKEMDLPEDEKETILDMINLYWDLSSYSADSEGFDWKAAEGIGMCIALIILKHQNQNKDESN